MMSKSVPAIAYRLLAASRVTNLFINSDVQTGRREGSRAGESESDS